MSDLARQLKVGLSRTLICAAEHKDVATQAAKEAGGKEFAPCVVYCLLVNKRWFKRQVNLELYDADLHDIRAVACEVVAKRL